MAKSWPQLILWQFYICLIRIFTTLHMIGHWTWEVNRWSPPSPFEGEAKDHYVARRSRFEGWLVLGVILIFHDIFMMTIDIKRTRTYLGCIAAQTVTNFIFTGLIVLHLTFYEAETALFSEYLLDPHLLRSYPQYLAFMISALLAGICSLLLLLVNIPPVVGLRLSMTKRQLWSINTKDALFGDVPPTTKVHSLSLLGQPRRMQIHYILDFHRWFVLPGEIVAVAAKRRLTLLFFRRVSPTETRVYAFARNMFAVIAIGVLIFRAVTALQQAQNETSTRVTSASCKDASSSHHLSILSDHLINDTRWDTSLPQGINVTISAVWNHPGRGHSAYNATICAAVWTQNYVLKPALGSQTRSLQLFNCPWLPDPIYRNWNPQFTQGLYSDSFAYRIQVQTATGGPIEEVYDNQMPNVWFLNWKEISNTNLPESNLSRSDITAEANLLTRKFIRSSIIKDVLFNSKPDYKPLSLYPIAERSVTTLNSTDVTIATAVIRPSLAPRLMYHGNRPDNYDSLASPSDICDFVEEYRTSTIFDIIGSVGGLFALLQSAHLLLFGRPLFWGLTGAKVITPFGLLGGCGSRSFRRRLKEEYHGESSEDGADTIRIVKFLRDFVVDFGPADLDPVKPPERDSTRSPHSSTDSNVNPGGSQIALVNMRSDTIPPRENDVHGSVNREEHRNRTHDIV